MNENTNYFNIYIYIYIYIYINYLHKNIFMSLLLLDLIFVLISI